MSRNVAAKRKPRVAARPYDTDQGVVDVSALFEGLPDAPEPSLDPFLDAAAQSFALYGIAHSSVPDIAKQMGVSRATVYRRIGTVESAVRLLLARELNTILSEAATRLSSRSVGPGEVIDVLVWIAEYARDHGVLQTVLRSDAELIGPFLTQNFSAMVSRASESVRPLLSAAMDSELIARRDPAMIADWLARLLISIGLAPPEVELRRFFDQVVRPVLEPQAKARRVRT
ncbi:MAG: hypothetical protein DCC49_07285 [Acidobacteria bacterium]|nr:MAG: hypothetical protein DCC49_07285 [Acidobacteriota bacterium]